MRTGRERLGIEDRLQGTFSQVLEEEVGDFVLRRRDGLIAYQLAVVVDDAWQGVTDIVRGIDLLDSTPRQLCLQQALELPTPGYMHLPVIVTPEGEKLSKQTGAPGLDADKAGELAWEVLRLLRQDPPPELRGARPAELWAWAVPSWEPQHLAGVRAISP
jgi:glutamyl-Q tRNA(Asp) synthetase